MEIGSRDGHDVRQAIGHEGPAAFSSSSGSLKQGSIWKAKQASSRSNSELAQMA